MTVLGAAAIYLADGGDGPSQVDSTTGHGPEWGEAAPIGLLVIVLLCIALYFLVKSMNRNLKKVPDSFEPQIPVSVGGGSEAAEFDGHQAEPSARAAGSSLSDVAGTAESDPPGPLAPFSPASGSATPGSAASGSAAPGSAAP